MDYSEMKATKTSKSKSTRDAISSFASNFSQGKSSSKKSRRTKKSGSTTRKTSSNKSKSKISDNSFFETTVNALKDVSDITSSAKSKKKRTSSSKKSKKALVWTFAIIFLLIGSFGGFLTAKLICKNDVYAMVCYENGETDIVIGQDEEYQYYRELGVKCVAFGRDCSDEFKVTYYYRNDLSMDEVEVDGVDTSVEGIYYAVYTAPSKKYSTVKLIRNIIVLRGEDDAQ